MSFLPPPISEETRRRTHRCVRCGKLTDPSLLHCDACGYRFTDEDRERMNECYAERRRVTLSDVFFPIALVGLVLLVVLNW